MNLIVDQKIQKAQYLDIGEIKPNPQLAHLLPVDIARRYHALPVAKEGRQITVAMANPEDVEAQQVVRAALGTSPCVVRLDIQAIDKILAELWPQTSPNNVNILAWSPSEGTSVQIEAYAQSLAMLLDGTLSYFEAIEGHQQAVDILVDKADLLKADVIVFQAHDPSLLRRLLHKTGENKLVDRASASLLIARNPRWPLQKILLLLRSADADQFALDWCVRLASASRARVTVLPVIPPPPVVYNRDPRIQSNLSGLLNTDCPLGRKLRETAQRLVDSKIEGTLRLREEPLEWQIRAEVDEGNYDLIILAPDSGNRLRRWVLGDFVNPLLAWADRPVWIAKN
jgi:nucleotide-binding universal stress UspA family protein